MGPLLAMSSNSIPVTTEGSQWKIGFLMLQPLGRISNTVRALNLYKWAQINVLVSVQGATYQAARIV